MFAVALLCITVCPFLFCNHLEEEEKVGIVIINVLWVFLTVSWVGLQYVIVVFPDHIRILF